MPNTTAQQVAATCPPVLTFAADGGTIKVKMATAFAAALAWPQLRYGRTDMTPLVYSLSGEKQAYKLLAVAVHDMVLKLLKNRFHGARRRRRRGWRLWQWWRRGGRRHV